MRLQHEVMHWKTFARVCDDDGLHFNVGLRWRTALRCRDALRKVKDAPRLLARLQSTPSMPDLKDFSLLQDSLANMLLLR